MRWSAFVACLPCVLAAAGAWAQRSPPAGAPPFRITEQREQCLSYQPLRQPFFGELHLHTEYSADAATLDTRNTPRDAYRFARGDVVGLPPFVDTRTAAEKQQDAAAANGSSPPVSAHPYCLPTDHCQFTATRLVQLPKGRQRRRGVPFNAHRAGPRVEHCRSRRSVQIHRRLFTRWVNGRLRRIVAHDLEIARFSAAPATYQLSDLG